MASLFEKIVKKSQKHYNNSVPKEKCLKGFERKDSEIPESLQEDLDLQLSEEEEQPIKPVIDKKSVKDRERRTIFVGNVSVDVIKNKSLRKSFEHLFKGLESLRYRSIGLSDAVGGIKQLRRLPKTEELGSKSTVNAYVVLRTTADAIAALKLNGSVFEGKRLRVDLVRKPNNDKELGEEEKKLLSVTKDTSRCVFVGNVPFNITDEEVYDLFIQAGDIDFVRVVRDQSGRSKGIAYVQFSKSSDITLALKLHGTTLKEQKIRVFKCKRETGRHEKIKVKVKEGVKTRRRPNRISKQEQVHKSAKKAMKQKKNQIRRSQRRKLAKEDKKSKRK